MRACNGCRKRKIKCDAATTNTWPCSACTRLKLVCVPPTIGQESEFPAGEEAEPTGPLGTSSVPQASHHAFSMAPEFRDNGQPPMPNMPSYSESMSVFPQWMPPPPHSQPAIYGDVRSPPLSEPQSHQYQRQQMFTANPTQPLGTAGSSLYMENEQSTAENLSEVLGELKIDETGIGMAFPPSYLVLYKGMLTEEPFFFELQHHILDDRGETGQSLKLQFKMIREKKDCRH